jgi:hypothetical protein
LFGTVVSYDGEAAVHHYPGYAYYDPSTESFSSDFYIVSDYASLSGETGLSVPYIADNGDIYWALRIRCDSQSTYHCVRVAKFTFDGTTLTYVSQSNKIYGTMWQDTDGGGDQNETALVKYNDVYYLSFRENNGFQNSISTSTDLSTWTTLEDLTWDDGTVVTGASTTHTRWITHSDGLYLVYTRASSSNPDNSSVFRYRAPLWIAKFDTATHRLIKSSERILLNMNGDLSIGTGFSVTNATPDATFVSTNEWGDGARALMARIKWDTPNALAVAGTTSYILNEPFDSLTGWTNSANPTISPAGNLRIYSTNGSTQNVYRTDKSIPGVYTAKWRVKVDSYQSNESSVLRIRDGSKLLQLRLENDALYVMDSSSAWVKKNVLTADYKWHEILVYVVNGQAEVVIDGDTQAIFAMPSDTNADRIELWTSNGDFYTDDLKIW